MFDNFKDYMYYLLPAPFKLVHRKINQWYIFLRVVGMWFDTVKDDLLRAADETTIATCSDELLKYYGDDRGMTQYTGEDNATYRSRIAMSNAVMEMGGTRDSILMAVNALGYDEAEHIWRPVEDDTFERWAEFMLELRVPEGEEVPVAHSIVRAEVRATKESISLDNYRYVFMDTLTSYVSAAVAVKNIVIAGD